jgi:HEAT repeat protein
LVIASSGLGDGEAKRESAPEQLTLVVEILANIVVSMNSLSYPRLAVARDLISLSERQPVQAKAAMAALARLGETIAETATAGEVQALINGILSRESYVRNGSLQALQPLDLTELTFPVEIFIGRFDNDEPNVALADSLWEENGLDVTSDYIEKLLPFLQHDVAVVRNGAAQAIAEATAQFPENVKHVLEALRSLYVEKARVLAPEFDKFGMVIPESLDRQDPSHIRVAVARSLQALSPLMAKAHVLALFDFLVIEEALGDRASEVRQALLAAGVAVVDAHGDKVVSELIARFEAYLAQPANANVEADFVKEGVIVLFGRLAKHLPPGDKRTPIIIDRLLLALETPSEIVQVAVADCLPPLVKVAADQTESFLDRLFETLTTGAKYAARRGAAYGLAGLVKGRGLSVLSENELLSRLQESTQDKKNYQARQGAVFAYETLTSTLGRAFEPYLISIIPSLLSLFGDAQPDVREATSDAAKVIMSKISGHCVKQILPLLLSGLDEKQWRTKKGSIELLGAMAFCAPKQLSYSLPTIIPQLTGVLTDSHAQVRTAANTSLKTFGEVLSNPEIKKLQPTLLKALADPTSKTATALTALLATSFEHYLDSPSLALVVPILDRGLKERSSETKRKSVLIVGNMASLTESRDFIPYLGQLLPLIQAVLVDPVPEARATAAKALGTLVERLGEENFPSLVTKLLQTLRSDTSGVDRQGAAQGLSEVLAGLGVGRMEGLLPDIINSASSPRPYVREGFISLLIYLPATFGQRFAPHLGRIIPPILGGLADESEYVREASMRAGKMIISNYASRAIELLLPELERGMLDPSWRIRQSSISLTGELLYKVTGISGKVEIEEDEAPAHHADTARKALVEALGQEGRDRVLAILYIVRQDDVGSVRQASIHIWKALVHNTPKTAREILPTLFKMMVDLMGSEINAQRDVASRTLTELCRKSGDRTIGDIIPMMRSAVANPMPRTREGACLALAELIDNTSSDHLEAHEDTVIDAVRAALIDEDSAVRIAAARAFDALQEAIGPKTIERTIPTLLEAMRTPGEKSETALMALKEVMSVSLPNASSLAYGCEANPVRSHRRNRSEPRPSSQLYYLPLQLSRLRRSTLGLWLHW